MVSIRKIGGISRTYRHLNRYRQLVTILFKYGFLDLVDLLKRETGLNRITRKPGERIEKLSRAERVRMAVEELGPTYIKLGQVLSTRPDLVPADFLKELSKLQDSVPPSPFNGIKEILESELRAPIDSVFSSFEKIPIASASIGQVHQAQLKDGTRVAVKVQRPNIRKTVEIDLEIMRHLAVLLEHHVEEISLHRPGKIVDEFEKTIRREMDFLREARTMERFAHRFSGDPTVYIPRIFRESSTSRVLIMEFVDGIKVSEVERLDRAGLDRKKITRRGANLVLKQVFDYGFFHADPHPGNIFVLPGNVICLLDFGMTGSVDNRTREDFVFLIDAVVKRDESRATEALLKLTDRDDDPDLPSLERDVADLMEQHLYKPLREIKLGRLLQHILELASHHRLRIPPNIFFMMKAISAVEGVALMLDPDFDMIEQARPFIEKIHLARYAPRRIADELVRLSGELIGFSRQFPKDLLEITKLLRKQRLSVNLEHKGLEQMLITHDKISNRISFSIIIASLIIGSAVIVLSKIPPFIYGISFIGIIGFITAAVMGFWLLIAILKRGKL